MPSPLKILIVDDTEDDAFFTGRFLQSIGLQPPFVTALGGPQAIEVLTRTPDDFALALLDIRMPQFDGFAVLEWIRARPSLGHLCAVMLTTSNEDCDVQRAQQGGANGYFVKYPAPGKFAAILSTLVPDLVPSLVESPMPAGAMRLPS